MQPGSGPHGSVIPAVPGDVEVLSQVIADAFFDLAPSRWLIADPGARREIFPGYFRIHVEHALASGIAHTTPERDAVALWLPVGTGGPPASAADYAQRLTVATTPWTSQFLAFDAVQERHHPAGPPHHYLAILAVHPDRQGQGTGTALLAAHHATLDAAGIPAYLEASGLRSRRLYRACGYADHGLTIHLAGAGQMFPMWRNPMTSSKPTASTAGIDQPYAAPGIPAADAVSTGAGWQAGGRRPARAGRQSPLGIGPLEAAVMQTLWTADRWLMNREIHALLDYRRPIAYTTLAAITGNLHAKGLVLRELSDAPGNPGLPAWHYRAARPKTEYIGALIATLLDHSPSPAAALLHALATTHAPIQLTPHPGQPAQHNDG
jgi:predicted transcriptional regulator/GNAT superfamily N-acetyltransferase